MRKWPHPSAVSSRRCIRATATCWCSISRAAALLPHEDHFGCVSQVISLAVWSSSRTVLSPRAPPVLPVPSMPVPSIRSAPPNAATDVAFSAATDAFHLSTSADAQPRTASDAPLSFLRSWTTRPAPLSLSSSIVMSTLPSSLSKCSTSTSADSVEPIASLSDETSAFACRGGGGGGGDASAAVSSPLQGLGTVPSAGPASAASISLSAASPPDIRAPTIAQRSATRSNRASGIMKVGGIAGRRAPGTRRESSTSRRYASQSPLYAANWSEPNPPLNAGVGIATVCHCCRSIDAARSATVAGTEAKSAMTSCLARGTQPVPITESASASASSSAGRGFVRSSAPPAAHAGGMTSGTLSSEPRATTSAHGSPSRHQQPCKKVAA
mmetsp:Transcript_40306/g.80799  ORF Transcript_40306/g.80799 Transcript_40306/m.80799 type:complete len:383 (-) Transcript_40306:2061-3209(-)